MLVLYARNRFWANRNMEVNLLLQEQRNAIPFLHFQLYNPDNTPEEDDQRQPQPLGSPLAGNDVGNDVGNERDIEGLIDEDDDGNTHLFSPRCSAEIISQLLQDVITLARPAHGSKIIPQLSRCLSGYLENFAVEGIMDTERPTRCMTLAGCFFPGKNGAPSFKASSSTFVRTNHTRSASFVRLNDGFGENKFFFTVEYCTGNYG